MALGHFGGAAPQAIRRPGGGGAAMDGLMDQARTLRSPSPEGTPAESAQLMLAMRGIAHDLVFSSTDADTVSWATGTIRLSDGTEYSIASGNTGNMAALTYVYLDVDTSETVLQTSTTFSDAVGNRKSLIAVAQNATSAASFIVVAGNGQLGGELIVNANMISNLLITASQIANGAITTDKLGDLAVTAAKIANSTITATQISSLTITAAEIANLTITAAKIGSNEVTNPKIAKLQCIAKSSADQSIADNTTTEINWDQEDVDTDDMHYTSAANLTGTVSKTASSATLSGSSTSFTTELSVGQVITVPGGATEKRVVTAIASNTSLTVNANFANTASGQTATRVNSAIVFRTAGTYFVAVWIPWTANATGYRHVALAVNAELSNDIARDTRDATTAGGPTDTDQTVGMMRNFSQWDFVEVKVIQTSGGSLNATIQSASGGLGTKFYVFKVH